MLRPKHFATGTTPSSLLPLWQLLLATAFVAVTLSSCGGNPADERADYDQIVRFQNESKLDSLGIAINAYLDTYDADATYFLQVKDLSERFFNERTDWQSTQAALSLTALRQFLDAHPDGFYLALAHHQFDSLSFRQVLAANTTEAYEQYIDQFPQGAYVKEARKKLTDLETGDLSAEEKEAALAVLTTHFTALGDNDRTALTATLAAQINSYLGKTNPELEDIYAYMATVHATGRVIRFAIKDARVAETEALGRSIYNIQFALDEDTYTRAQYDALQKAAEAGEEAPEAAAPAATKHFTGAAVLNENMKITSLVLRQ